MRLSVILRTFYRVAVVCLFTTLSIMVTMMIVGVFVGQERINSLPLLIRLPLGLLGAFCSISTIAFWLGMILDCVFTSKLTVWSKIKWLFPLVLINVLGALIYYYRIFNVRPSLAQA